MIDVEGAILAVKSKRPLFHSEADFQHALGWQLRRDNPSTDIRLEYRPNWGGRPHIDIWVMRGSERVAIELKYKTRQLSIEVNGESYDLASHAAQDTGRYDFVKDIRRLELVTEGRRDVWGVAIILTNDSALWKPARSESSADASFRVHDGRVLSGLLGWGDRAGPGTRKGREPAIELTGTYTVQWRPYSSLPVRSWAEFRYAAVRVGSVDRQL